MDNQKDTQRTTTNDYGQLNVSNIKSLSNIAIPSLTNKKTEKLVTALYLVSDCMDSDDALKNKIRLLGVRLLSDIYEYSNLSPVDKPSFVTTPISRVYELLSFIEIAKNIGFISEMNASILNHEFSKLAVDLRESISKDRHFSFTLDDKMFEIRDDRESMIFDNTKNNSSLLKTQDNLSVRNFVHDKNNNSVSYDNHKAKGLEVAKKTKPHLLGPAAKEDRIKRIMTFIKVKKDVSLKEVAVFIPDYSEKTILRELNGLLDKGQIKKTGVKRWSRYQLVGEEVSKK